MKKSSLDRIIIRESLNHLTEIEMILLIGGESRWRRWLRKLGEKAGELFPCYCSSDIDYSNYEDYVNPNDPLM